MCLLVFRKCFPFILGRKHFSEIVKNLEMSYILFVDYIKFSLQTFDCYIFYFESFFF